MGHVQSGKTANYSGLICKAADVWYKISIVLLGIPNNLRAHSQLRHEPLFRLLPQRCEGERWQMVAHNNLKLTCWMSFLESFPNFGLKNMFAFP